MSRKSETFTYTPRRLWGIIFSSEWVFHPDSSLGIEPLKLFIILMCLGKYKLWEKVIIRPLFPAKHIPIIHQTLVSLIRHISPPDLEFISRIYLHVKYIVPGENLQLFFFSQVNSKKLLNTSKSWDVDTTHSIISRI